MFEWRNLHRVLIISLLIINLVHAQDVFFPGSDQTEDADQTAEVRRPEQNCPTLGGPAAGKNCVFPFRIGNRIFEGCTRFKFPSEPPWCSTKIDPTGEHIDNAGHWGYCDMTQCELDSGEEPDEEQRDKAQFQSTRQGSNPLGQDEEEEEPEWESCKTTKGQDGLCRPSILCVGLTSLEEDMNACGLPDDSTGVCCVDRETNSGVLSLSIAAKIDDDVNNENVSVDVTVDEVDNFIGSRFGGVAGGSRPSSKPTEAPDTLFFEETDDNGQGEDTDDLADLEPLNFHLAFNAPTEDAVRVDQTASELQNTAQNIGERNGLNSEQTGIGLRMFNSDNSQAIKNLCPWIPGPKCDRDFKYRSHDGTCNNVDEPSLGRAITPYQRIVLPEYTKGSIHLPRRSSDGLRELPSARQLSTELTKESNSVDDQHTVLVMQMGQFVDHDITHTPNHGASCCGSGGRFPKTFDAEKCFPIEISPNDPFWKGKKTCMSFARSLASPGLKCSLEFRQQMNQITHWLDGSNIYGSSKRAADQLRTGRGGQLAVTRVSGSRSGGALPSCSASRSMSSITMCKSCSSCFFAGDVRANEQLNLIVMHTVWVREHNRVARFLSKLNPNWNDEKIYQETRRIVVAEYQHIVYKEWLPLILGTGFMDSFGLWPLSKGYSTEYRDNFDPRITNEFAAAAFRFGHSLIPSFFERVQRTRTGRTFTQKMQMKDVFFKPNDLKKQFSLIDDLMKGLTTQEGESWDNGFVPDITDHLFEGRSGGGGLDLVALNIQRGRDHGIAGYNAYREICKAGNGRAQRWEDLEDFIPRHQVQKLRQIYRSIDDIDLYVGGFLERPHQDSILGPTFKCIIGDQFARLKLGDRFFYDLGNDPATRFTPDQLQQIRRTSMARVICDNTDTIRNIQPHVFRVPSSGANSLKRCDSFSIPSVNLGVFRESVRRGKSAEAETEPANEQPKNVVVEPEAEEAAVNDPEGGSSNALVFED